jgi:hypothetical protein
MQERMNAHTKRPLSILVVALLFIATGIAGTVLHASEIRGQHPLPYDALWAMLVSLLGLVCGVFLLLRHNWARWLAVAWLVFHAVLSAFHSRQGLLIHIALLVVITYVLFTAAASAYFRSPKPAA